jgi:hypothetical protein
MVRSKAYHCEVYARLVLEGIQQSDEPLAIRICENISLSQNVSNLIQFKEQRLAHNLECANLLGIPLLGQVHLTVPTLTNLCEDLEIALSQASPAFSQICTLPTKVFGQRLVVFSFWHLSGVLFLKLIETRLTNVYIAEQVIIVIEEIFSPSANTQFNANLKPT